MGKTGYFIYNQTEEKKPFTGGGYVPPHFTYLKHFRNFVELTFIYRACVKDGHITNIAQAKWELEHCQAKLERAEARKDFVWEVIRRDCEKVVRDWGMTIKDFPDRWR